MLLFTINIVMTVRQRPSAVVHGVVPAQALQPSIR
jgi:hypothetical protein